MRTPRDDPPTQRRARVRVQTRRSCKEVKIIVNSLVVQPWTLRLGPVVLVGVVLRRPSSVRREAVMDELPREVETRRGASRREEARAGARQE